MKRQFSAGGIIFKPGDLWLVRKPKANEGFKGSLGWSFPKGIIDPGETSEQAALREVREEAGVEAEIIKKLPPIKIFFTDHEGDKVFKTITYFVMKWKADLPEGFGNETEVVVWLSREEAREQLAFPSERELLDMAGSW